jgi:hypothetical protein
MLEATANSVLGRSYTVERWDAASETIRFRRRAEALHEADVRASLDDESTWQVLYRTRRGACVIYSVGDGPEPQGALVRARGDDPPPEDAVALPLPGS